MTRKNKSSYADKHGKDLKINPDIAEMVKMRAVDGKMPCAVAFEISEDLKVTPYDVGANLDLMEIKISKCQMGIFGYPSGNKFIKPMKEVPVSLSNAVRENLIDGRLSCRNAWEIAERLGIGKMEVVSACDGLGIKISPCQLGAF